MAEFSKSILDVINNTLPERDKFLVTESRGSHIIASASNFVNMIRENFSEQEADDLVKRLINSIRTNDPAKFNRGLKHIKESKNTKKD